MSDSRATRQNTQTAKTNFLLCSYILLVLFCCFCTSHPPIGCTWTRSTISHGNDTGLSMRPQETRKQYKEMQKGARPVVHRFPCLSSALLIPVILLMNGVLKTVVTGRLLPSHIETRGSPAPRSTPSSGSGGLRKGLELAEAGAEEAVQDESVRRTDCCSASSRVVLSTPSHVLDTLSAEEEMRATSCSIKMTTNTHSIASRGEERFASHLLLTHRSHITLPGSLSPIRFSTSTTT